MKIAIIIVNYRTPEMVADCLNSLKSELDKGLFIRVFVGDSCSGDHSESYLREFIEKNCSNWCEFLPFDKNGGFAYGNNFLIRHGVNQSKDKFDYIHFLNPDTRIKPDAVSILANFLESHPKVGVVGSLLTNEDDVPEIFGFRYPTPLRHFFIGSRLGIVEKLFPSAPVAIEGLKEPTKVDWVTGASFMIPSRIIEQVGLMDDRYFLYYEEIDFMRRIMLAGNEVWFLPESVVVHMAGQSTGVRSDEMDIKRVPEYWYKSRYKFLKDHYGDLSAKFGIFLFVIGDLLHSFRCLLLGKRRNDPPYLIYDSIRSCFSSRRR